VTCYHPIPAWLSKNENLNGKKKVVFSQQNGDASKPLLIPCGQCIGCRLERSRVWALRCVHEASLYTENCFITLTYDDEHMPEDGSVNKRDWQLFMKKLRKNYPDVKLKYYMCGEYGNDDYQISKLGRPHYHACLFNFSFPDAVLFSVRNDIRIYTSEILSNLWQKGFVTIGDVTFESAAYVARYVAKKITGEQADSHYYKVNYETGELNQISPEFNLMSRRPGIGYDWWRRYNADTHKDFVTINGVKMRPPRYYDTQLEKTDKELLDEIKLKRKLQSYEKYYDNLTDRLLVKEKIKLRKYKQLPRNAI